MFLVCLEAKLSPYAALRRALPKENKLILAKGKRCALGHCAPAAEESPTLPSVHPTFPRSSTHRRRLCAAASRCRLPVWRRRRSDSPTSGIQPYVSCKELHENLSWPVLTRLFILLYICFKSSKILHFLFTEPKHFRPVHRKDLQELHEFESNLLTRRVALPRYF